MTAMLRFLLALLLVSPAFAQLPEFYKTVSRITWVTADAARTARAWTALGLSGVEPRGELDVAVTFRGKPATARARWTAAWFGEVAVDLIEPLGGGNAWAEFQARHGEGIFALMHEAPTEAAFDAEVERMRGLGVAVLQSGLEPARHVYFDTLERGGYALGLVYLPGGAPRGGGPGRIAQFAFAVRELGPVSRYWESLGWPAMRVTRTGMREVEYRGKTVRFDLELGWQRHGTVPYEWCVAPAGAGSIYREFLERGGAGVQHLGVQVPDIDRAVAEKGFAVSQAGAWGEPGKKGYGRYAYLDTEAAGGVTVELLWSLR